MTHLALLKTGMFVVSTLSKTNKHSSVKPTEIALELLKQFSSSKTKTVDHPEFRHCDPCHEANVRYLKQA